MQEKRDVPQLSERERGILILAGEGLTDKEIAQRLDVAVGTVNTYWERLRQKLQVANKAEAVAKSLAVEYRHTLAELDKANNWLRLIVEAAEDYAIFMINEEGVILSWSTGVFRVLGYSQEEFIGRDVECLFTEADVETGAAVHEREFALEHGRSLDDRWHKRRDGSHIWVKGTLYRLDGPDGQTRFAKIMRDATTECQLIEELNRVRKSIREEHSSDKGAGEDCAP